ncbi:chemotaxis protein CheW [Gammaproteobacteria bacterium]
MAIQAIQNIDPAHGVHEFLTFTLGAEEYAVDILKVQEIRGYDPVTPIANTPSFIKGVVNLRGAIVPIVDLRIKFQLGNADYHERTVVIVLNLSGRIVGTVVDGVSDVVSLGADQIKPAPEFGNALDTQYLMGLGTIENRMLILVDIERLMTSRDMALVDESTLARRGLTYN